MEKINALNEECDLPVFNSKLGRAALQYLLQQRGELQHLIATARITIAATMRAEEAVFSGSMEGTVVAFSGIKGHACAHVRQLFVQSGAQVSDTLTKNVTLLVIKEGHVSRKVEQARLQGVRIVTHSDAVGML